MTEALALTSATTTLRKEHEAILRMVEAAELVARRLDRSEPVSAETLRGLVEFFRVFADHCHHAKEEELLFPLLERKGLPRANGPLGVMTDEHEEGRALIRYLDEATAAYQEGATGAAARWAGAAWRYATLLREHINKENSVLFLLADRMLSDAEQRALSEAFEMLEEEKIGAGTHARLHALMEQLTAEILGR